MTAAIRIQRIPPPATDWHFWRKYSNRVACSLLEAGYAGPFPRRSGGETWLDISHALERLLMLQRMDDDPDAVAFRLCTERGPA